MSERFDVVVIGAGPAGEVAAGRLGAEGMRTALVERELIGGECAYWACIPSKTMLRPPEVRFEARRAAGTAEPELDWAEIASYRDFMIRDLDDAKQIEGYRKDDIAVYKRAARLAGPGRVEVGDEVLETERVVLATGSDAKIPPIDGLEQAGYWTNREATTLQEVPESAVILGGGPVGIELGQLFRRLGTGAQVKSVARSGGVRVVALEDGSECSGAELVVAVGRAPRVKDLGLETVGIEPRPEGIAVDERCRAAEGVWAVGDVTGVMPFTHVGKYQARVACEDIAGRKARASYSAVPRVVFSDPELAAVGLTEAQARERDIDVATAHVELAEVIARPSTYEREPRGELGVLVDRTRKTMVGAWAVAPLASEWIHFAVLAIKTHTPPEVLQDTVPQFPSYCEGYLKAFEQLEM